MMSKITITVEGDEDPEKIARAIAAAQAELKPHPDKNGYCQCSENLQQIVHVSDWAGGSYCKRCGGASY